ncbi:MAG: hypothetical protein ACPHDT_15465 [Acidimicrobiales bacterium]
MSKTYFVMFATDPDVDPRKCAVGIACASQIASDGHTVDVFFAAHAVRLLHAAYIDALDEQAGQEPGSCRAMLDTLIDKARGVYCSTGSQALAGVTPDNADSILVPGLDMHWSGPPGVSTLSASAERCLSF